MFALLQIHFPVQLFYEVNHLAQAFIKSFNEMTVVSVADPGEYVLNFIYVFLHFISVVALQLRDNIILQQGRSLNRLHLGGLVHQ